MSLEMEMLHRYGNIWEVEYQDLLYHVLDTGEDRKDRTGVGTKSIFHATLNINLKEQIPVLTTKKLAFKSVVSELLWFLEGSDDERRLAEIHYGKDRDDLKDKKTIWTANANKQGVDLGYDDGLLGPIYGVQWRDWNGTDQIRELLVNLVKDPRSRRHILSAWNVDDIDKMALPPCHLMCQFHLSEDGGLSCALYQRSCDLFLGVPFNIASYSLLTYIIAKELGYYAKELIWIGGDVHIYNNHIDAVKKQIKRTPYMFPKVWINPDKHMGNYTVDDFKLEDYRHHDAIKAEMAV